MAGMYWQLKIDACRLLTLTFESEDNNNTMVIDEIAKYGSYVIYGAQVIAVGARKAIVLATGDMGHFGTG